MALNVNTIAADILAVLQSSKKASNSTAAQKVIADGLAAAIDKYIRTGTVATAGTAAAQTGTIS